MFSVSTLQKSEVRCFIKNIYIIILIIEIYQKLGCNIVYKHKCFCFPFHNVDKRIPLGKEIKDSVDHKTIPKNSIFTLKNIVYLRNYLDFF